MNHQKHKNGVSFTFFYILFVLLFLSCTAALTAICMLLGQSKSNQTQHSSLSSESEEYPIIVIDAGHGGEDGGTSGSDGGTTVLEKHLNLDISQTLYHLLTDAGYSVVMTRTEDTLLYDRNTAYEGRKKALDMAARLAITEEANQTSAGAIFISIHMNSFPQSKYNGLQVYYSSNHTESKVLAQEIQNDARTLLQPDNTRNIKESSDNIYLLKTITCPAVLVECGFLSNPKECSLLNTQEYRDKVAYTIFHALREYLEK